MDSSQQPLSLETQPLSVASLHQAFKERWFVNNYQSCYNYLQTNVAVSKICTCLQGAPLFPRESVPTWQLSVRHSFLNMRKIRHCYEKTSTYHRVSSHWSIHWIQVLWGYESSWGGGGVPDWVHIFTHTDSGYVYLASI